MNIVLIGYRGSGKTTIGRILAGQRGLRFIDVDQVALEAFVGLSIAQIWEKLGEPAWRAEEVKVTRQLCLQQGQVLALGGGTLMQAGAREAVEQARDCRRIYLRCTAQELLRRVQSDQQTSANRPNLTGLGGGLDEIQAMLGKREPVYLAVADHVVDVTSRTPEQAAAAITELLPVAGR